MEHGLVEEVTFVTAITNVIHLTKSDSSKSAVAVAGCHSRKHNYLFWTLKPIVTEYSALDSWVSCDINHKNQP